MMSGTAVVTGGSRGIGRAIAIELARSGFNILFQYHSNEAAAQSAVQDLNALGVDAVAIRGDVAQQESATKLAEAAYSRWGSVDVLVNNAGITRDRSLVMMDASDGLDVINTNLNGTFLTTRAFVYEFVR